MDDVKFLEAMLSHESINKARQVKIITFKEKDKNSKDLATKNPSCKKCIHDSNVTKAPRKHRESALRAGKTKKYCAYCKENDGEYWTQDTDQCFVKAKAKESNVIEMMQKKLCELKVRYKKLKKFKENKDSDSDSSNLRN